MEPLDTEYEYVARRPSDSRARFNWLYIVPALGLTWLLYLLFAVIFQLPIGTTINPIMGFMLLLFFVMVGLIFWAYAPKSNR